VHRQAYQKEEKRMSTEEGDTTKVLGAKSEGDDTTKVLEANLGWLADAPLFIDGARISSFYDAVVHPEFEQDLVKLRVDEGTVDRINREFNLTGKLSLGSLGSFFVGLLPSAEIGAGATQVTEKTDSKTESQEITLRPISTPQSQLVQLTLHYLINHPERLFILDDLSNPRKRSSEKSSDSFWMDPQTISEVPRELVFINLPSREEAHQHNILPTKLIPITIEFDNGDVEFLYEKLKRDDQWPPAYPEGLEGESTPEELAAKRRRYWYWFDESFSPRRAMMAIEESARGKGRIRWITYRVPLNSDSEKKECDTLHLSISPAQQYETGTFIYTLIRHGYEHGLRLVGTLRSEPSMNVLAIYEK
jgi:hypothetical protein